MKYAFELYAITKGKYCEFVGDKKDCETWLKRNGYFMYVHPNFNITIKRINVNTNLRIQDYIKYCFGEFFDGKKQVPNGM